MKVIFEITELIQVVLVSNQIKYKSTKSIYVPMYQQKLVRKYNKKNKDSIYNRRQ